HDDAVLAGEFGHELAVIGKDLRPGCRDIIDELLMVGQIAPKIHQRDADKTADTDGGKDDDEEGTARDPAQDSVHRRRAGKPLSAAAARLVDTLQPDLGSAMVSLPRLKPGTAGTI